MFGTKSIFLQNDLKITKQKSHDFDYHNNVCLKYGEIIQIV